MHAKEDIHVVLAAIPFYGHVRPISALARGLVDLGYSVTFITGSAFRETIEKISGIDFVALQGQADMDPCRLDVQLPARYEVPIGPLRVLWDMEHLCYDPIVEQHNTLQKVLRRPELRPKRLIVIAESMFHGTLPILLGSPYARRVPVIHVGTIPLPYLSRDTPGFGQGLPSQGWRKNAEHNRELVEFSEGVTSSVENMLKPFKCTRHVPSGWPLEYTVLMADVFCQLGVPAVEPRRCDLPEHVRFVGALLGSNNVAQKPHPHWFEDFVLKGDCTEPLILVTSGTLPGIDANELIIPAIQVCKDLPVRLLVCGVEVRFPSGFELPKNVRWAEWIAFEEVFPHVSFIISNGGYGGINQAFAYGVPMILAGISEDKTETSFRATLTGAAINLQTQTPAIQQVKEAVEEMLHEPSYKKKAMEVKKSYEEHNAVKLIVGTMHELIEKFAEVDSEFENMTV